MHLKIGRSVYNNGTLPILANKVTNHETKDNVLENCQDCRVNGSILPNEYQQYYELDQAFITKGSDGQSDE